jgi:hypothetical protein
MNSMPDQVALVLEAVVVVGGLVAAIFWLASANVTVPTIRTASLLLFRGLGS